MIAIDERTGAGTGAAATSGCACRAARLLGWPGPVSQSGSQASRSSWLPAVPPQLLGVFHETIFHETMLRYAIALGAVACSNLGVEARNNLSRTPPMGCALPVPLPTPARWPRS